MTYSFGSYQSKSIQSLLKTMVHRSGNFWMYYYLRTGLIQMKLIFSQVIYGIKKPAILKSGY